VLRCGMSGREYENLHFISN